MKLINVEMLKRKITSFKSNEMVISAFKKGVQNLGEDGPRILDRGHFQMNPNNVWTSGGSKIEFSGGRPYWTEPNTRNKNIILSN